MTLRHSNHVKDSTVGGVTYGSISDMVEDNTPTSTQINNSIVSQLASRRRPITIVDDDQQNRKHKIKQRLREKLRKKKAKKQS